MVSQYNVREQFGYLTVELEYEENFSQLQYKMISGGQLKGLLESKMLRVDGNIMMVYFPQNLCSVHSVLGNIRPIDCINIIKKLLAIFWAIESNGYVKLENVLLDIKNIYIDTDNQDIYIVYIPIENNVTESFVIRQILMLLNDMISITELSGSLEWELCRNQLWNKEITFLECVKVITDVFENVPMKENYILNENSANQRNDLAIHVMLKSVGVDPDIKIVIDRKEFCLGRDQSMSDYNLQRFGIVSRRHCLIRVNGTVVTVRDLKSRNGTYIDGKRLVPETEYKLEEGHTFSLGTLTFLVHIENV